MIRNTAFAAAALVLGAGLLTGDIIFINGNVLTMDSQRPVVQAFAVRHGRFLHAGTNAEVRAWAGKETRFVDLRGRTVIPGIIDAHLHPRPQFPEDSRWYNVDLSPARVRSLDELVAALKRKAAITPRGQTVSGFAYQDTRLGRHPTREDLDRASADHPIVITHSSGHITAVNSMALALSGITRETADPPGGSLDRSSSGEPNGVLRESARRLLKTPSAQPPESDRIAALVRCLRNYAAAGITSVGVAGGSPADLLDFQKARDAGSPVRVSFMYRDSYFVAARDLGLRTGFGDEFLKLGSVKIFHGNSLSGRTCWLKEEYSDRPGYFGIPPARSQEDLDRLILNVHRAGWQAAVHSNGDREIEMVLTAIERAQAAHPRSDARHRIEHASVCTPEILKRAKAAGVVLVFHSYQWEHGDKQESYGEKRLNMMHPHRSALDLGIAVAGHSDHPVSAAIPMLRIHDLVNRQGENGKVYGPAQRIGVEEALRVFTLGSAHAQFEEKEKGSIAAGKLADFLVLAEDPRAVPASRIKDIRVMETWIGGKRAAGGEGTPGSN